MRKITTIFERNWEGNRTVIDQYTNAAFPIVALTAKATEKLDGMNVRLTVRRHTVVRVEKRRNPDKRQKAIGIEEPWYVDADPYGPEDKYIFEAVVNTKLGDIPDGEWSGEAVGPRIQGNPLGLEAHEVCLFSCGKASVFENVPITYAELKVWLPLQKTKFGSGDRPIEGIVWHCANGEMFKIKTKDFYKDGR